jgi:hypothetical protein
MHPKNTLSHQLDRQTQVHDSSNSYNDIQVPAWQTAQSSLLQLGCRERCNWPTVTQQKRGGARVAPQHHAGALCTLGLQRPRGSPIWA